MTPDGDIDTKRVYEQLALTGKGNVDLANPIATAGLRNLDGFGGFEVKDGEQLVQTDVDGEKKLRSVSDFNGDLPLDIDVNYELDGRTVKPGDLVGKSGKLEVTFDVENVTGEMQEVEVPDGKGGTITKTVEVPIPMVGSLTSVAPGELHQRCLRAGQPRRRRQGRDEALVHDDPVPARRLEHRHVRLHRRRHRRRRASRGRLGPADQPAREPDVRVGRRELPGRRRHRRQADRRRRRDRRQPAAPARRCGRAAGRPDQAARRRGRAERRPQRRGRSGLGQARRRCGGAVSRPAQARRRRRQAVRRLAEARRWHRATRTPAARS